MVKYSAPIRSSTACLLIAGALLSRSAVPAAVAQGALPRFEPSTCPLSGDWARNVRRDCGWLIVPESRSRASTSTIRLAVEVFRAREPTGAPPLVLLHGGPGGQGGIRLYSAGVARSSLPQRRDVVVYDQRGAGLSEPRLCPSYDSIAESVYRLRESPGTNALLAGAQRACIAELGTKHVDRLAYNTAESAADLVDLRHALGYSSWIIRGTSYGARLAQEVMLRDANGISAVVLASPVARSFPSRAEQPLSTQRAMEQVFVQCARQPACRQAFPDLEPDFYAAYAELTASPMGIPVTRSGAHVDTVWLDGKRFVRGLRDHLAGPRTQLALIPLLVHELHTGDRLRAAREMAGDGSAPALLEGRPAREIITCYDTYGPAYRKTLDSANALARPPFRRAPDRDCEVWLPRFADSSLRAPVHSDIPTLIITGAFDDRTPTEYARRIAATLGAAYQVELPDEGHDPRPSACHAAILAQFIENPTRQPDTTCVASIAPIPFVTTWDNARDGGGT